MSSYQTIDCENFHNRREQMVANETVFKQTTHWDYLDAVRAFAMILGIVFHASLSFLPIFIGWAVMDVSTSMFVGAFSLVSHSFRMELFFLIAGFFAHMKYHQVGTQAFLKSRIVRIGVPFIVGWFIVRALLVSGWTLGAESMRGDVDYYAAFLNLFNVSKDSLSPLFTGTHLWFLYYLLLSTVAVIVLRRVFTLNQGVYKRVSQFMDNVIRFLCQSRWGIILLAIPTSFCLWFMGQWGVDTPDKSLIPHTSVFLLYSGFFMFGWLLHRSPVNLAAISVVNKGLIVLTLVSIVSTLVLSTYQTQYSAPYYSLIKAVFSLSYTVMMWSLVWLTLGAFNALVKPSKKGPNKFLRYIADASYWLYLVHLPVVVYLQVAFAELPLPWLFKWVCICVLTLIFSLATYAAFVRSTIIGKLLNGKKLPRLS